MKIGQESDPPEAGSHPRMVSHTGKFQQQTPDRWRRRNQSGIGPDVTKAKFARLEVQHISIWKRSFEFDNF